MDIKNRVISRAKAEIGYLEKASNFQLDSMTANAGYNNYNKYARDLDALGVVYNFPKNGYSWCDIFYDWLFITEFGVEVAMKMLYQDYKGLGAGCYYSAQYYRNHNAYYHEPEIGDQIFFLDSDGDEAHTGIVVDIVGDRVYTIEGNTSSESGVVANGGCVAAKSYHYLYSRIGGYGRPNWDAVKTENEEDIAVTKDEIKKIVTEIFESKIREIVKEELAKPAEEKKITVLSNGSIGEEVKKLQRKLVSLGYALDVDGVFGPITESVVKKYQKAHGLLEDGIVGEKTSASLYG